MNRRSHLVLIILAIFTISGCGIVSKSRFEEEVSTIKTRVETLESRLGGVEAKQQETEAAELLKRRQLLEGLKAEKERRVKTNIEAKPRFTKKRARTKEIQLCLMNAGFYDGEIDGIKGKRTRRAIREFQKANGLVADGIVGKKTWEVLSKYAQGPVQDSGAEEGPTK